MRRTRKTASAATASEGKNATRRSILIALALAALPLLAWPLPLSAKVAGGDIEYAPKGAGRVRFDHAHHVRQKGLGCTSCHATTFPLTGNAAYRMDMSQLTKGKFCGICHNGRTAFDVKDANNCVRCHKD